MKVMVLMMLMWHQRRGTHLNDGSHPGHNSPQGVPPDVCGLVKGLAAAGHDRLHMVEDLTHAG